jgi:hypothetical protein
MFLRQWREGRIKKMRAELEAPPAGASLAELPAAGARWKRMPDGSWMRWSYLGESWEAQTAPPILLKSAEETPGVITWTVGADGVWKPYDAEQPPTSSAQQVEEKPVEQLPPPPSPKLDPELAPRPEWTSDWKPGWGEGSK